MRRERRRKKWAGGRHRQLGGRHPSGRKQNQLGPSWGWAAGAIISDLNDLRCWARTLATGSLLSVKTQAQRLRFVPTGFPDTAYGVGVFDNHGWIGHNGSLPGYQSAVVYLPQTEATLVILSNSDTSYRGYEPSTLLAQAITRIVTPGHVYSLPAMS
jgi:D-alanyl-D-alanine carboxypeptidase